MPKTRQPTPPIFIVDGHDVQTFTSVEAAEAWLETPDVEDVLVVDAQGRRVRARAVGAFTVLDSAGAIESSLKDWVGSHLVELLSAIGVDIDPAGWNAVVRRARANAERINRVR